MRARREGRRRTYDDRVITARRAALAAGCACLAIVLAGCTGGGDPAIEVATVGRATVVEVVEAPATVTARATATVSSPADGTVARLRVREGQQVRAGQVLLRVESPDARRRLRQARRADARAATSGTSGPRRSTWRRPAGRRRRPARLRPGPPRRAAHPAGTGPDPGAVRAAGLAVAVRRGPGERRPGGPPAGPGSAASPTRSRRCPRPSGCRPGQPSTSPAARWPP